MSKARYQHTHGTKSSFDENKSEILPAEIVVVDSGANTKSGAAVYFKPVGGQPIPLANLDDVASIDYSSVAGYVVFVGNEEKPEREVLPTTTAEGIYPLYCIYINPTKQKAWVCTNKVIGSAISIYTWILAYDLSTKVDKTTTIAGMQIQNGITAEALKEAIGSSGVTLIDDETSQGWSGEVPNTYAGDTGAVGELALYENMGTLWYLEEVDNSTYTWTKLISANELATLLNRKQSTSERTNVVNQYSTNFQYPTAKAVYDYAMGYVPKDPTAEQIASLPVGQIYSDTTNHKAVIKTEAATTQEFYDTTYIDSMIGNIETALSEV